MTSTMSNQPSNQPTDSTTLTDVLDLYAAGGFDGPFGVTNDGRVECQTCGTVSNPSEIEMHSRRRLEGASDPDDMVAVMGVSCPACGTRGTLTAQVGPMASAEDAHVTSGLRDCRSDDLGPADAAPGEMIDDIVTDD
jgi:hypothetical protein